MGEIQKSIEIYESLRSYQYRIVIEDGTELLLKLDRQAYHHLAGLQHLTDIPYVSDPPLKDRLYNDIRSGKITESQITASEKYAEIAERIHSFSMLKDILSEGRGKIIVEFDNSKADSKIQAKFHLFKRDGVPFQGDVSAHGRCDPRQADRGHPQQAACGRWLGTQR